MQSSVLSLIICCMHSWFSAFLMLALSTFYQATLLFGDSTPFTLKFTSIPSLKTFIKNMLSHLGNHACKVRDIQDNLPHSLNRQSRG